MKTAAVIVAHGSDAHLRDCLTSVAHDVDETVLIDNGSGDGRATVEDLPLAYEHVENRGFGAAQNLGVARTSGEALLLLNPDARMCPGALAKGIAVLEHDPAVAAVQGACRSPQGDSDRSQGMLITPVHLWGRALGLGRLRGTTIGRLLGARLRVTADHVDRAPTAPAKVAWLSATALLIRREAFEEVGGFDEGFFMYGEDLDLCARLLARDWNLVALPDDWAIHHGGGSFGDPWWREVQWWRGTLRYAAKWWGTAGWVAALTAALVRSITLTRRNRSSLPALIGISREAHRARCDARRPGQPPESER